MLSHAAGLIGSTIRAHDIAGRVGGEEFCIVLPGATKAQALQIAERIRQRINDKEILVTKARRFVSARQWGSVAKRRNTATMILSVAVTRPTNGFITPNSPDVNRICASDATQEREKLGTIPSRQPSGPSFWLLVDARAGDRRYANVQSPPGLAL